MHARAVPLFWLRFLQVWRRQIWLSYELDLNTTMMYRHEDYVKAMELVTNQLVALEPLQSKVFPFSEYQQAYEFIDANRETSMKVLIDVQDDSGIEL